MSVVISITRREPCPHFPERSKVGEWRKTMNKLMTAGAISAFALMMSSIASALDYSKVTGAEIVRENAVKQAMGDGIKDLKKSMDELDAAADALKNLGN